MKIVLASNYLNVHQRPFCEAMLSALGAGNFTFVASTPFNELRLKSGYEDMNQAPFVVRAYEDYLAAERAVLEADVLIGMPYSNPDLVELRMNKTDGLTFVYSERLLKRGLWFRFFLPKVARVHSAFTKYRDRTNFHVLCASAFTSYDLSLFGFPSSRCWKWGYFPTVTEKHGLNELRETHTTLLWTGRLIQWKRPYWPVVLAERLMHEGRDFHLTMIGDGEMRSELEAYIRDNGLLNHVTMTGSIPNLAVHQIMAKSDIFLFTSNRVEGWGAVLNEAMGNGCVPVASSLIGSVPYLINDGFNGRVFPDGRQEAMYCRVADIVDDREVMHCMGERARSTMTSLWNPKHAVESLIELSDCLLSGEAPSISEGPCSPACIVRDSWYGDGRG